MQLDTPAKRKKARHGVATRRSKRWGPPKKAGRRGRAGPVNWSRRKEGYVAVDSKLELAESGGTESGEKKKKKAGQASGPNSGKSKSIYR